MRIPLDAECPTCGRPLRADAAGCPWCKVKVRPVPRRDVPPPPPPWRRPIWAIPAVVLGLLAAVAATGFDALFLERHLTTPGRYDSFVLMGNLVLVPLAAVLLATGALAILHAEVQRRPWLRMAVLAVILAWAVGACWGPSLATDVQPAL
jgi:hypothetical protein